MKISVLSLAIAGATLVSASVIFSAKPTQAFTLTYTWYFDGLANTSGTFVADDSTGFLSSISGTVDGTNISTLLPVANFVGNDNLIPLTLGGISFEDANNFSWNFYAVDTTKDGFITTNFNLPNGSAGEGNFRYIPVPEPLTIIGSITALGFGGFLKRKLSKNQKD